MVKKISWWAALVLVLTAILITFMVTFLSVDARYREKLLEILPNDDYMLEAKLEELDHLFRELYIGDVDEDKMIEMTLKGYIAGTGDKYGQYMTADEYREFTDEMNGNLYGIGILSVYTVEEEQASIEAVAIIPDSPAERAGLCPGDRILAVNGETVTDLGYTDTISKIKGELGTTVQLTIARGEEEPFLCDVMRDHFTSMSVMYHMYADGSNEIGIVKILQFDATTVEQCKNALTSLNAAGARYYIFDMRNNGGGELESVLSVLDYLLPAGPLIHIVDADGAESIRSSDSFAFQADGMAVLVNGETASAAELFSCALRDYDRAKLVGTTTYGKGCMQTIRGLADGGALRVTYRYYNPPYSENYDGIGLIPDVEVEPNELLQTVNLLKVPDEEDNQLAAAVALLRTSEQNVEPNTEQDAEQDTEQNAA